MIILTLSLVRPWIENVVKSDVIQYALEQNGITDLAHTIMIGDREHDVLGAQAQKLDSIGVPYGFGSREELKKPAPPILLKKLAKLQLL